MNDTPKLTAEEASAIEEHLLHGSTDLCRAAAAHRGFRSLEAIATGRHVVIDAQELEGLRRDAERWKHVEKKAHKKTAYDVYGNGAFWTFGVFSEDQRQSFAQTIDASMQESGQ